MRPWRATIRDAKFDREAGFAIVMASDADEARRVVEGYLVNDTAYGVRHIVGKVVEHVLDRPHVLFMNWGPWDEWPPETETETPSSA